MATQRDNPYGAFNFIVALGGDQGDGDEGTIVGGFSDVERPRRRRQLLRVPQRQREVQHRPQGAEHAQARRRHAQARARSARPTCSTWLKTVRDGGHDPRNVTITLLDEARNPVAIWKLRNAQPKKWIGPTLAAKGGGEVAMEELHLVPRRHRVRVMTAPVTGVLGAPGVTGRPDPPVRALTGVRWTCARSPASRRAARPRTGGRRCAGRGSRGWLAGRSARSIAVPVTAGTSTFAFGALRGPGPPAVRGGRLLRPGRRARLRRADRPRLRLGRRRRRPSQRPARPAGHHRRRPGRAVRPQRGQVGEPGAGSAVLRRAAGDGARGHRQRAGGNPGPGRPGRLGWSGSGCRATCCSCGSSTGSRTARTRPGRDCAGTCCWTCRWRPRRPASTWSPAS